MPAILAATLDAGFILLFSALGRNTHAQGLDVSGILATAGPFLAAAAIGWLVTRAWRTPFGIWPAGVVIWLLTVVGGLALRWAAGDGVALAFQLVSLGFLGLVLLGHRLIGTLVSRRTARMGMD